MNFFYADGRRALGELTPRDPNSGPGSIVIRPKGGGGSDHTWDGNYWVHPLPPPGPLVFVASWPAHGVAEARAELDAAALRRAAAEAVELWPEEPDFADDGGYTNRILASFAKDDGDEAGS